MHRYQKFKNPDETVQEPLPDGWCGAAQDEIDKVDGMLESLRKKVSTLRSLSKDKDGTSKKDKVTKGGKVEIDADEMQAAANEATEQAWDLTT